MLGKFADRLNIFKLTFLDNLAYSRKTGYRIPKISISFKVLDGFSNLKSNIADLEGETSNALFDALAQWNDHLKDTDLDSFHGPKP